MVPITCPFEEESGKIRGKVLDRKHVQGKFRRVSGVAYCCHHANLLEGKRIRRKKAGNDALVETQRGQRRPRCSWPKCIRRGRIPIPSGSRNLYCHKCCKEKRKQLGRYFFTTIEEYKDNYFEQHYSGPMEFQCPACGALHFEGEKTGQPPHYNMCCRTCFFFLFFF